MTHWIIKSLLLLVSKPTLFHPPRCISIWKSNRLEEWWRVTQFLIDHSLLILVLGYNQLVKYNMKSKYTPLEAIKRYQSIVGNFWFCLDASIGWKNVSSSQSDNGFRLESFLFVCYTLTTSRACFLIITIVDNSFQTPMLVHPYWMLHWIQSNQNSKVFWGTID